MIGTKSSKLYFKICSTTKGKYPCSEKYQEAAMMFALTPSFQCAKANLAMPVSRKVSRECANEESEAGIAYAKIKAVYPRLTKEDMQSTSVEQLMAHENIKCLGSTRKIEDKDSLLFYKKLQSYVDSKEKSGTKSTKSDEKKKKQQPYQQEWWPLIRVCETIMHGLSQR
jgi:hypothetical protein